MTRSEWIVELAREHKWTKGAEIGAGRGTTTLHLVRHLPNLRMLMVDTWRANTTPDYDHYDHGRNYGECLDIYRAYPKRTKMVAEFSHVAAKYTKDRSLDFVFIDASHDYESVSQDIWDWATKVRHMIMGHDYCHPGVNRAVKEMYDQSKYRRDQATKIIEGPDSCWAVDLRERRENEPSRV